jgi:hypothetical protein
MNQFLKNYIYIYIFHVDYIIPYILIQVNEGIAITLQNFVEIHTLYHQCGKYCNTFIYIYIYIYINDFALVH